MKPQYQHIRHGPCSVKPEYYLTMHKLKSELHLSENQAQGVTCTVANNLFVEKSMMNGNNMKEMNLQFTIIYQPLAIQTELKHV